MNAAKLNLHRRPPHPLTSPQTWGSKLDDAAYYELLEMVFSESDDISDQYCKSAGLFAAVIRRDESAVERILILGGVVAVADKVGRSPLHHGCRVGGEKIVGMLCDYGADVEHVDSQGNTPLHIGCVRGKESIELQNIACS